MVAVLATAVREVFRREAIPVRVRWWFVAEAMTEWCTLLADDLADPLGGRAEARSAVADIASPLLRRRYDGLRATVPTLPDPAAVPRSVGLVMGGLYRVASNPAARWIFEPVGGAPRTFGEHLAVERWLRAMPVARRWEELTCHLGELLIALTESLPPRMPRANAALGDLCFAAGVRFGKKMKKAFELGSTPEEALEVLRMSEYVFRVNPEHWGRTDSARGDGWLEGTACPWFTAAGWTGAHCGVFGQFQSGISSAYGLRYHLTTTIPKHGGTTCRIDVRPDERAPVRLRRSASEGGPS